MMSILRQRHQRKLRKASRSQLLQCDELRKNFRLISIESMELAAVDESPQLMLDPLRAQLLRRTKPELPQQEMDLQRAPSLLPSTCRPSIKMVFLSAFHSVEFVERSQKHWQSPCKLQCISQQSMRLMSHNSTSSAKNIPASLAKNFQCFHL